MAFLYFFALLFNVSQHILQLLTVLCQEHQALFEVAGAVLPADVLQPIKPLHNLLELGLHGPLLLQLCTQRLPSSRLSPALLLQLGDLILQRTELLLAVGVLLVDPVLGEQHVVGDAEHQLQEHLLHLFEELVEAGLHEVQELLCALADLKAADLDSRQRLELLQDDALHHHHHLEEVILERQVDAQHARLRGEPEELRLVGHRADRHGGGREARGAAKGGWSGPGSARRVGGELIHPLAPLPQDVGREGAAPPPPTPPLLSDVPLSTGRASRSGSNSLSATANRRPESGREHEGTDQSPSAPAHGGGEYEQKERGRARRSANEDAAWLRGRCVARLPIGGGAGEVRACAERRRKRKQRRGAKMAYQTFRQEYLQVPPVTRAYTTACVLTTAAVVRWAAGPELGAAGGSLRENFPQRGGPERATPSGQSLGLGGAGRSQTPANGSGRLSRYRGLALKLRALTAVVRLFTARC